MSAPQVTTPDSLLEIARRVAAQATADEQVEAYVAVGQDTDVTVYGGEIESLSSAETAGVGIRVISGHRQGFAYTGSLVESDIAQTLAEARDNASFATVDEFVALAAPDVVAPAAIDLWRDALADYPTEDKVSAALELERLVRAGDPRVKHVRSASWGDASLMSAIASSKGVEAASRRTVCYVGADLAAVEGEESQTGYGYSAGRAPSDVSVEKAASDAVERATRLLGAVRPDSRRLTVVLEPEITASLLAIIAGTLNGEAVLKGRSIFAERVGEQVGSGMVTLVDDPTDPEAWGATVYDAEGLATRRNSLIADGVLQGYLYDTYAAARAGTRSTASAVRAGFKSAPGVGARAIALRPGSETPEEIYRRIGDGLLVQSVSGLHSGVNPISGDFSVGAEGLLIRNGVPTQAVRETNIASTLQKMLQGVVAVGNDVTRVPSSSTGLTLAIEDVSMSGS